MDVSIPEWRSHYAAQIEAALTLLHCKGRPWQHWHVLMFSDAMGGRPMPSTVVLIRQVNKRAIDIAIA